MTPPKAEVLEERIVSVTEPFLGAEARDILNAVSASLMKVQLSQIELAQVDSLAYWMRTIVSSSDIDITGSVADLERSIRSVKVGGGGAPSAKGLDHG